MYTRPELIDRSRVRVGMRDSMRKYSPDPFSNAARITNKAGAPLFGAILLSVLYIGFTIALFTVWRDPIRPWATAFLGSGVAGIFMIPLTWACFLKWRQLTYDITAFPDRYSGNVAVSIRNDDPDPETAAQFIAELTRRVLQAEPLAAGGDGIADQLSRLAELHRKGILTAAEFCSAKQRVLDNNPGQRKIGF